jgi:hypothetical protein
VLPAGAKRIAIDAAAVILAASAVFAYFHFKPVPAPPGVHIEAPPSPVVEDVGQHDVTVTHVHVYKPEAKIELALPAAVVSNTQAHVVASTLTPNDERQHTITTMLDSGTGKFTTYDRVEPLPWISVTTKSEVGAYLGLKNGEPAIRIEGRQEILQIKAVRIGAIGNVDAAQSAGVDSFIGVGAWARW